MKMTHMEGALLLSLKKDKLPALREFLSHLKVSGSDKELRDCFLEHNDRDNFPITTDDDERLIVILGSEKIHLILLETGSFAKVRDTAVRYLQ